MSGVLRTATAFTFVILLTTTAPAEGDSGSQPPAVETAHFLVEGPDLPSSNLQFYAELCEITLMQLRPNPQPGTGKFRVRVSHDSADFETYSTRQSHNTLAVAYPAAGRLILNGPALRRASPRQRHQVVTHEMTHLLLGHLAAKRAPVPYWLHEGLAQIIAGESSVSARWSLLWASIFDRRIPMTQLTAQFPYEKPDTELAYAQSASFTRYVIRQGYAFKNAHEFLEYLLVHPDRAQRILAQLAEPYVVSMLDDQWRRAASRSPNLLLALTSSTVIWFAVVALFLIAAVRKNKHVESVVEGWDEWEQTSEIDPDGQEHENNLHD